MKIGKCAGVAAVVLMSAGAALGGDIVSGTSRMTILQSGPFATPFDAPNGDGAIFAPNGSTDQLYKYSWYYRTELDSSPRIMSSLTTPTSSFVGDTARFVYTDTGPGVSQGGGRFDATITAKVVGLPDPAQTRVQGSFTIKNRNSTTRTFRLYHIVDLDLPGGTPNPSTDDALNKLPAGPTFRQTELASSSFAEISGPGADGWRVGTGTDLRALLNTSMISDVGTTFVSATGDVGVILQWTLTLAPNETRVINTAFGINAAANPPACPADFNNAGGVTVQDIFDYLTAWFSNSPSADFNGAGGITVQDVFDFLTAWFTGCP